MFLANAGILEIKLTSVLLSSSKKFFSIGFFRDKNINFLINLRSCRFMSLKFLILSSKFSSIASTSHLQISLV